MSQKIGKGRYYPVNEDKYIGNVSPTFRSSWELEFMRFLDEHSSIVKWASEPIKIPYYNEFKGQQSVYVPDFLIVYVNNKGEQIKEMLEIKPASQSFIKEAKSKREKYQFALNMMKWQAAEQFCNKRDIRFRVITEDDLYANVRGKRQRTSFKR